MGPAQTVGRPPLAPRRWRGSSCAAPRRAGISKSLHVTFAGWVKTIEDRQELQAGNTFKSIPTEPASLTFLEELK
jgi:hypothetical protein